MSVDVEQIPLRKPQQLCNKYLKRPFLRTIKNKGQLILYEVGIIGNVIEELQAEAARQEIINFADRAKLETSTSLRSDRLESMVS